MYKRQTGIDSTAGGAEVGTYLELVAEAPGLYLASGLVMIAGMAGLVATGAALVRVAAGMRRAALLRTGAILIGGGLGGAAYVLGVLATGIGLILVRGIPSWTGILVLAAPIASFTGGPLGIPLLAASGFVLAAIGLAGTIPVLLRKAHLVAETADPDAPAEAEGRTEQTLVT